METWSIILISISICVILKFIFTKNGITGNKTTKLPPGPPAIPLINTILMLIKPMPDIDAILRDLRKKYGSIITLPTGYIPTIFVANHAVAHQALIQNGAIFADRPPMLPTVNIITSNQHNISTSIYGSTWRLLRRNLTAEILHPSRVKSFSPSRKWVVQDVLIKGLLDHTHTHVHVVDHIRHAMFCLTAHMCFGENFEEKKVKEIQEVQRGMLLNFEKFLILDFWPRTLWKIVFRNRWEQLYHLRKEQENLLLPMIKARKFLIKNGLSSQSNVIPYVDTLFDLKLTDEKNRALNDDELVTLCSEFLDAGTDTTTTSLQWIMANLVKNQDIQETIYSEIKKVVKDEREVKEEHLQDMPYLKAVILEGLRRHPPGHFLLPHKVTQEADLGGYLLPKHSVVNFMVAEMGWDPQVWKNPMEFKPERFLMNNDNKEGYDFNVDITGTREIKMMPFGAGRRICPGHALGMLHLEYFIANLVRNFSWKAVDGVDLSLTRESSMVMKYPLKAQISARP